MGEGPFAYRHRAALTAIPVWLVASGPLDDSADAGTTPAVPQVAAAAAVIGARGEVTFGGWLAPDVTCISGPAGRASSRTREFHDTGPVFTTLAMATP